METFHTTSNMRWTLYHAGNNFAALTFCLIREEGQRYPWVAERRKKKQTVSTMMGKHLPTEHNYSLLLLTFLKGSERSVSVVPGCRLMEAQLNLFISAAVVLVN